jgi:hypothetical protein
LCDFLGFRRHQAGARHGQHSGGRDVEDEGARGNASTVKAYVWTKATRCQSPLSKKNLCGQHIFYLLTF